jgi:hypothetical protein
MFILRGLHPTLGGISQKAIIAEAAQIVPVEATARLEYHRLQSRCDVAVWVNR